MHGARRLPCPPGPPAPAPGPPYLLLLLPPVREKPQKNYALAPVIFGSDSEMHCLTTDHKSAFQLWWKAAFLTGKGVSQPAVGGGSAGKQEGIL